MMRELVVAEQSETERMYRREVTRMISWPLWDRTSGKKDSQHNNTSETEGLHAS